jgi:hypothetical protein
MENPHYTAMVRFGDAVLRGCEALGLYGLEDSMRRLVLHRLKVFSRILLALV